MGFSLPDHWVWDFWLADDGDDFHLFFLHARKSLGNPDLRHRNARIGHATSPDLRKWTSHGEVLAPGPKGAFDDTATWTGSVVKGNDGLWRLFYTGSHFLSPDANPNIETIGVAVSRDLYTWQKRPGPVCRADSRWYETLGTSSWPEEAWRDPWVFADPEGNGWHMLITARSNEGEDSQRGVVGHAVSEDLETWTVRPPLSKPGADFGHLEVVEPIEIDGKNFILFSCETGRLTGRLAGREGGVWSAPAASATGPYDIARSTLLVSQRLYAGRLVRDRKGQWQFMGFNNASGGTPFEGGLCDPIPVALDSSQSLVLSEGS